MRSTATIGAFWVALLALFVGASEHARGGGTITVDVTVAGTQGPWSWVNGGLNTNFQYGVNDQGGPTIVSAASGIDFAPGGVLTVNYVSGTVFSPDGTGQIHNVDANGDPYYVFNNNPGSTGKVAPSYYMNPATYPIYLVELVGTFANSSGAIVGTPFVVGDGPTMLTIPVGATQLQLGANDDLYSDNGGAWTISVTGPAIASVPEPNGILLLLSAGMMLLGGRLFRTPRFRR
jgi:hypothetical protein